MRMPAPGTIARITLFGLVSTLPLIFTIGTEELFEFPKMLVVYASAIIVAGCFLLDAFQQKRLRLPATPFDLPILFFFLSQLLSTVFSINLHTSLFGYYSRFNGGLFSVISYILLYYGTVYFVKKEDLGTFLKAIFLGGVLAALYALPEHFGVSPSCVLLSKELTTDCWSEATNPKYRVFGTLGQPNWLAAYLVVLIPIVVAQIQEKISKGKSLLSLLLATCYLLLFFAVLLFTKSRSGILGAGVALGVLVLFSLIQKFRQRSSHSPFSILNFQFLSPLLLATCYLLLVLLIGNPVRDRIFSVLHVPTTTYKLQPTTSSAGTQLESGGSESGDIRKVVWSGAIQVWKRYPLLGSGVETFAYSYYKDRPVAHNLLSEWDFLYNKAHNEFLNYLATTGIVGLFAYLTMYGSFTLLPTIWIFKKSSQYSLATCYLLLATSCSLAGLAVSNFFGFSTVLVSTLTFILPALAVILTEKTVYFDFPLPSFYEKFHFRPLFTGAVLLATCYLLLATYFLYSVDTEFAQSKQLIARNDIAAGVSLLQDAVDRSPNEPVYRDELAYTASRLAYAMSQTGESTQAAAFAQAAIDHSDLVIAQNSVNVVFYKTRIRILLYLARITPVFYEEAKKAALTARDLSPTDPKLTYNLAQIALAQGDKELYKHYLEETVTLRPIDLQAKKELEILATESAKKK